MKGIVGSLGQMKIQHILEARPIKKRPYRLKPNYKEKERKKLHRIMIGCQMQVL